MISLIYFNRYQLKNSGKFAEHEKLISTVANELFSFGAFLKKRIRTQAFSGKPIMPA
jgi:hypothetical protein